jgi:hypothetical protein
MIVQCSTLRRGRSQCLVKGGNRTSSENDPKTMSGDANLPRLSSPLSETITRGKLIYRKELAGDLISKRFRVDEDLSHLEHSLSEMPIHLAEMQSCCS